eukprot:g7572.t1
MMNRLPRKARSDPFAYFSKDGPYSIPNDQMFQNIGGEYFDDLIGPDVRLNEKLHKAAKLGRLKTVKKCLELGANIDSRNHILGWTALHYAAHNEHEKVVRFLAVEANGNIEAKSFDGKIPVDLCDLGSTYTFLIRWEKEVARRKRQSINDILKRSRTKALDRISSYSNAFTLKTNMQQTNSNTNTIENMLENNDLKKNSNCNNIDNTMVVEEITNHRNATALAPYNLDVDGNKQNETTNSITMTATQKRAIFSIETLCDTVHEKMRRSAAVNDVKTLGKLIAMGIHCDPPSKLTGWAPIHYAAYSNNYACVKLLLDNGANPETKTVDGKTALQLSLEGNRMNHCESYKLIHKWIDKKNTDKKYRRKGKQTIKKYRQLSSSMSQLHKHRAWK